MKNKTAIIIGAGPAGLTAAYQLLKNTDIHPLVIESDIQVGGISKTVEYKGNRIDIGGHRFFSKSKKITDFWQEILPTQGQPSIDDKLLGRQKDFAVGGPDPEKTDEVMLVRDRVSRILFLRKFFDYPISVKFQTFRNMGMARTLKAVGGYAATMMHKRKENSLEDFYINRFGRPLYSMFFEDYTRKVWGLHPSKLGADWGSQRVKGLSVMGIVKDIINKHIIHDKSKVETSLIESFVYPKYGPGQLWEKVADNVKQMGGEILMQSTVVGIHADDCGKNGYTVTVKDKDGKETQYHADYLLSSMPIKDLVAAIGGVDVPESVKQTAATLPYRDFITVGLLLDKMKIQNTTKIKTYLNRIPDTWIYVQERDVNIGRLQIFNNWSPYMVADYRDHMWIGLEFFCTEGDEMWTMPEADFINMAIDELAKIDVIDKDAVLDSVQIKIRKAYPAYYGSYYNLGEVRDFLDTLPSLYCIGRNGQHRYNNMDHSMLTAMEAVDNIITGRTDRSNIWNVNTEEEYHESK